MAFVEHVAFRWADKITVERDGDKLFVFGQNIATEGWKGPESLAPQNWSGPQSADVLLAYSKFAQFSKPLPGEPSGGVLVPHVQFANADSDEKLIAFVRKYGPINGLHETWRTLAKGKLGALTVTESVQRLRRERMVFAAAVRLFMALSKTTHSEVADALGELVRACVQPGADWATEAEAEWHGKAYVSLLSKLAVEDRWPAGMPLDAFLHDLDPDTIVDYGSHSLCLMLNTFSPVLIRAERGLIEMPRMRKAGILPALFFLLRQDCLLAHEIKRCERLDCGRLFKVERLGQRFCSAECSQLQRQRDYWERKGKKARALREAGKRKRKGGK